MRLFLSAVMINNIVSSVFLESLQQNYSWLAESVQTKQASDITDFSETSHLNDILLKGGVPHPPSFSIARAREVGISTHIYSYLRISTHWISTVSTRSWRPSSTGCRSWCRGASSPCTACPAPARASSPRSPSGGVSRYRYLNRYRYRYPSIIYNMQGPSGDSQQLPRRCVLV